ncbi:MAG TPA: DinB family protein [Pseudonocardiaceae bacterium]|jgi:uncharacterized damage-inducible protein DinB
MTTSRDDLLDLSDYAWQRLRDRMTGLTDAEYRWKPVDSSAVTALPWRLNHIADFLTEDRNAVWLGLPATEVERDGEPDTAAAALAALEAAYASWRALLDASTEDGLAAPIGKPAGRYGTATRRSFVLHILDELIHHGAEAALLRDLYATTVQSVVDGS